jgi:molecular chaperone HtpG
MMTETSQIPFLVETNRILEILSKQIYDSPYAMVRENVQNAYDAILMRAKREGRDQSEFAVNISASPDQLTIRDNGIGMSEAVLRENFWRAGSSGKNNDEARAAGVIGTFGIGAMANFGVCNQLRVETREVGASIASRTSARKDELNIGANCIKLERLEGQDIPEGTTLTADVEPAFRIDVGGLRNYLEPYVRFVRVPVFLNGELLSGKDPKMAVGISDSWKVLGSSESSVGRFAFSIHVWSDGGQLGVIVDGVRIDGHLTAAALWLRNQVGQVMGLRSRFGLAPIPVSGIYQFGGFADLPFLLPTAGREALTRESIQEASQFLPAIEVAVSKILKDTELADSLSAFQQHILQMGQTAWAGRVKIQIQPGDRNVELASLKSEFIGHELHWYAGTDAETARTFTSEERPLMRLSQHNPRRELQQRYLSQILNLPAVPDSVTILESYAPEKLSWDEVSLTLAIGRTLRSDYLIDNVDIRWAKISHGVEMLAQMEGDRLTLTFSRTWPSIQAVLKVVEQSPDLIDGITKDFVRVQIYSRIQSFVPSSQRIGLDALQKSLERKKELYRLEPEDKGELEPLLADYLAGKLDFGQVLTAATHATAGQTQQVSRENVGTVEQVLHDVVNTPVPPQVVPNITAPAPGSPILRPNTFIRERLLTTGQQLPALNNHRMFLALSDRLFQREREFFVWPHSTQVAWAGRRIVYLFSLANSGQSLYYDIELRGNRSAGDAGGLALVTTTIIASNRIFVPVPLQLAECFHVTDTPMEFYVRFDVIARQ